MLYYEKIFVTNGYNIIKKSLISLVFMSTIFMILYDIIIILLIFLIRINLINIIVTCYNF